MSDLYIELSGSYSKIDSDAKYLLNTTDNLLGTLGIGIAHTEGTLHVHTATAGSVTAATVADDLVVENSVDAGISILTPDASWSRLYFGSVSSNRGAQIVWNYDGNSFIVGTVKVGGTLDFRVGNNASALSINSSGKVAIVGDTLQIQTQKTPATAAAAGVKGDIVHDTNYIYVCTATNTWKRSAIATW